jgi:hypothetical protein
VQGWLERRYGQPSRGLPQNPGLLAGLRRMLAGREATR